MLYCGMIMFEHVDMKTLLFINDSKSYTRTLTLLPPPEKTVYRLQAREDVM